MVAKSCFHYVGCGVLIGAAEMVCYIVKQIDCSSRVVSCLIGIADFVLMENTEFMYGNLNFGVKSTASSKTSVDHLSRAPRVPAIEMIENLTNVFVVK